MTILATNNGRILLGVGSDAGIYDSSKDIWYLHEDAVKYYCPWFMEHEAELQDEADSV